MSYSSHKAQMTIRGGSTAHIQIGNTSHYDTLDIPANSDLKCYFDCQIAKGNFSTSFAGSKTKYVPVEVTEQVKKVRVVRAISPASEIVVEA